MNLWNTWKISYAYYIVIPMNIKPRHTAMFQSIFSKTNWLFNYFYLTLTTTKYFYIR